MTSDEVFINSIDKANILHTDNKYKGNRNKHIFILRDSQIVNKIISIKIFDTISIRHVALQFLNKSLILLVTVKLHLLDHEPGYG